MQIVTAEEAALKIKDYSTVAVVGMGLSGWPDQIGKAIADRFSNTGHPCCLNLKQGSASGDFQERGTTRFGIEGLVSKWSGAHIAAAKNLVALAVDEKIECHCLPQGMIVNQWREIAAGRPGLITKIGLNTFVDPRYGGGAMNASAQNNLIKLINIDNEEYLFYPSFNLDVALVRGTFADEEGNIGYEHEPMIHEGLSAATAAKNSGGIVIAQVEYLAKKGTLNPKNIRIPGILVDYLVVSTDKRACWQSPSEYYDPSFSGEARKPISVIKKVPLDERKVIARRCAAEIKAGDVINLGMGIPVLIGKVLAEENALEKVCMSTESGIVGGISSDRPSTTINPDAFMEHNSMFDLIDGGGLDMTCLGMGELDEDGNVNVSKFGKKLIGPGGFIDLTQSTKKVVFCGTLMGQSKLRVDKGKLIVEEEGTIRKFVKHVKQITFNGKTARDNQEILYITERCVLKMINGKLTIIEVAPGIDLQTQILDLIDFPVSISSDLRVMDSAIFSEKWGGLNL